jgi:hypothetical protein
MMILSLAKDLSINVMRQSNSNNPKGFTTAYIIVADAVVEASVLQM